ncbi:fatty acyl-AMP ligase [Micromonospora sp. BQ11]|uniref:fatty acyl-AMP ligase n=1 Tax=Micromonospora sp. BQ11 TaxID=3452212 RepID=UPI003F8A06F7
MSTISDLGRIGQTGGLPSVIRQRAEADPGRTAMTFVSYSTDPHGRARDLTYGELDARVRALGRRLRQETRPGGRAAILCPTGVDYIVGFVACLYSGVIAVPLFAPDAYRRSDRIALAMDDCGCEVAITSSTARDAVAGLPLRTPVRIVCPADVDPDPTAPWEPAPAEPGSTAYLQYTSGSTRRPAGVRVTHRNMATAVDQLATGLLVEGSSTIVSWLPLFHDMGLVFAVLLPLTSGTPVVHLTPLAFVQQPYRWLRLLAEHRGTHVLAPNFGFDFCVDRVTAEERAGLDLSTITYLGNGAEPVRARTLARFTETFAPSGFRPSAHAPAYGLAEATLMVTGVRPGQEPLICSFDRAELNAGRVRRIGDGDTRGLAMVGCGPALHQEVRIVDPATGLPAGPEDVGEIWVRGDNVCAGYWDQDELTAEVFDAVLDGERGWLRTGDLGFFYGGSLFIAGRRKDLIIVDGRNHHPIDIELTVEEAVPVVRRGHVVAFPVEVGTREHVVIAAELQDASADLGDQRMRIRRAVAERHDVSVHDVVFVRRGTLPKTSSGKLQRRACRDRYHHKTLTTVDRDARAPSISSGGSPSYGG